MAFLQHFNPAEIKPEYRINRDDDVRWVVDNFRAYFDALDATQLDHTAKNVVAITGDKGQGKSIFAQRVMKELRAKYSSNTLFLTADCRKARTATDLLAAIASELVREIDEFRQLARLVTGAQPVLTGLAEAATLLSNIAHSTEVTSTTLHSWSVQWKAAAKLGSGRTLGFLATEFGVQVERDQKDVKLFETKIKFDEARMYKLMAEVFADLRASGLRVFLLIDNIEELKHDYEKAEDRAAMQEIAKQVLSLVDAPIATLLCMRSYFASILPRVVRSSVELQPLPAAVLLQIVDSRFERETPTVQAEFKAEPARKRLAEFAQSAKTPLAMLDWVDWCSRARPGFLGDLSTLKSGWRGARYHDYEAEIAVIVALFQEAKALFVGRDKIMTALSNDEEAFRYMLNTELLLARDFWRPTHFQIDPTARWL